MNRITSAIDAVRVDDLHSTEEQFRTSHPVCWRITLYGPLVGTACLLALLVFQTGWEFTSKLVTSAVVTVCFFGRFIILSGTNGTFQDTNGALASEHLLALVCYLDVMTALMLAFHIGFLFRLPYVGPRVAALVTDGHFILDAQPWMRRATFFGLIAFVGFPLAATGSIGGSIFGRLLGMSRIATFFGIVIGTLMGNTAMFLFSDLLGNYVNKDNLYLKLGGFVVIAAIILILERRYRKLKDRFGAANEIEQEAVHSAHGVASPHGELASAKPTEPEPSASPRPSDLPNRIDGTPTLDLGDELPSRASVDRYETLSGDHVGARSYPR